MVDGSGDGVSATLAHGTADGLKVLRQFPFSQSLGWFYETVAEHLGLGIWTSSGKLMGLAGYGSLDRYTLDSSPPALAARREGAERRHRDGRSGTCHHQPGHRLDRLDHVGFDRAARLDPAADNLVGDVTGRYEPRESFAFVVAGS